ncbi:MAG TPA: phosphate acyltransferase PlsX [Gammaproteobacteria bacterium]|nr:phosphate acyltransferase PlsX [Gammaproteobacteria bacterium]
MRESNSKVVIAIDVMSGDRGPELAIDAALERLHAEPDLELILVGDTAVVQPLLAARSSAGHKRLRLQHASEVVGMDEPPQQALRGKKDSSMRVAINLVKDGAAQACISAGNTGALMATARFVLKTLPGIDRPAIISPIPAMNGHTLMLDLGANTDCTPEHLFQFGVMGSALATAAYNIERPAVGLLNVGAEEIKGNDRVKQAAQLLNQSDLNYIGFVEGNDIFSGRVDVVVSDGFVGNVALKTIEGLARMIGAYIRQEFTRNQFTKLLGGVSSPVLRALKRRLDPRLYNGASLLGLNGIVIKSHGGADQVSFANAIRIGMLEAEKQVPKRITRLLESQLIKEQG